MKSSSAVVVSAAVFASGMCVTASAEAPQTHLLSGQAALTTDYRFRGISQTTQDLAIQSSVDYSHTPSGIYAGVWASSLDFGVDDPDAASVEVDLYGGLAGTFEGAALGWNAGVIYYAYPGSDTGGVDYDYVEVQGSLSRAFDLFSVSIGVNYSPDYFFESGDFTYLHAGMSWALPNDFSLDASLGHNDLDDVEQFGTPDYFDWSIALSRSFGATSLALAYVDTDIERTDCFGGASACGSTIVATVAYAL